MRYLIPEDETWKPIEMRRTRWGSKRVTAGLGYEAEGDCQCDARYTCGPCLDDHVRRLRKGE